MYFEDSMRRVLKRFRLRVCSASATHHREHETAETWDQQVRELSPSQLRCIRCDHDDRCVLYIQNKMHRPYHSCNRHNRYKQALAITTCTIETYLRRREHFRLNESNGNDIRDSFPSHRSKQNVSQFKHAIILTTK